MSIPLRVAPRERKRTTSRCPVCLVSIPAAISQRGESVYMTKTCPRHGVFEVLLARDASRYYDSRGSDNNRTCGDNCGCAPAFGATEDQFEVLSTCIALIEIVDSCNLTCPTCYAASPWGVGDEVDCITVDNFKQRVGGVIDRKGFIDILQLSGGEPTIHPQFFDILRWSLDQSDIGYILINTNAVRIARDAAFRDALIDIHCEYSGRAGFELYVQFDGPQPEGQVELRAADLREVRRDAIDHAGAGGVPTTLAMTVTPTTINHLGDTLRFGLERPHVRGISFQPMFTSGRVPVSSSTLPIAAPISISVGDVVNAAFAQSRGLLSQQDFTPLPCGDPNCHTIGYLLRTDSGVHGVSRYLNLASMQGFLDNRINYNLHDMQQCGCETEPLGEVLKQLELRPDQPFRIFIKPFMDAWTFDQDRIDRCCTHVIRPDGTLDSFCRYYLEQAGCADA